MTQSQLKQVERAARSNALWCEAMCRAHGTPGEFQEALWLNRRPSPRFYPNAITLVEGAPVAQLAQIRALLASSLPRPWAVKDSFCQLELGALSFQLLFEARWIWRDPEVAAPVSPATGPRWERLHDASALAQWEVAWVDGEVPGPPLFVPALLADPDIAVLAAYEKECIIAGGIAYRSEYGIDFSNVFAPPDQARAAWLSCAALAQATFPGLPLIGYESDNALTLAQQAGFEVLTALRVWLAPT